MTVALCSVQNFLRLLAAAWLFAASGLVNPVSSQVIPRERTQTLRGAEAVEARPRVVEFAPREERLLVGDEEGSVWSYGLGGAEGPPDRLGRFDSAVLQLAFSTDGSTVAVVEEDGTISVVDAQSGDSRASFEVDAAGPPHAVALSESDGSVALVAMRGDELTWQRYRAGARPQIHRLPLASPVALSNTGLHVVGRSEGQLVLWTAESQRILAPFEGSRERFTTLAISPSEQFLAAATDPDSNKVVVWDMRSGRRLHTFPSPVNEVAGLKFLRREPLLSVAGEDGETIVLNVRTGDFRTGIAPRALEAARAPMTTMSPDMTFAASAEEGEVEISEFSRETADSLADDVADHEDEAYVTVPVFYGTNRVRRSEGESTWTFQFREFFITTTAFILYAAAVLAPLIAALVFNPGRKILLAITGVCVVLLLAFASVYATARVGDIAERPGEYYGAQTGPLEYGRCEVTVPKNRELGELPSPLSIWVFRAAEDVEEHVILQSLAPYDGADQFLAALQNHTVAKEEDTLLVYIHGYNTTFEDAARRAAQLSVDLQVSGPPVIFSWPSHGDAARYTFDQANANASIADLREFLKTLVGKSGAKSIHVLAHSMGNLVFTHALRDLTRDWTDEERGVLKEVVLAAPDVDRRVFIQDIAPVITPNHHVTLYVSARDRALQTSKRFHDHQRVGDAEPVVTVLDGMDTIDASAVDTSTLGHSYYSEQVPVLVDLLYLLQKGVSPAERFLQRQEARGQLYWRIIKGG